MGACDAPNTLRECRLGDSGTLNATGRFSRQASGSSWITHAIGPGEGPCGFNGRRVEPEGDELRFIPGWFERPHCRTGDIVAVGLRRTPPRCGGPFERRCERFLQWRREAISAAAFRVDFGLACAGAISRPWNSPAEALSSRSTPNQDRSGGPAAKARSSVQTSLPLARIARRRPDIATSERRQPGRVDGIGEGDEGCL